MIFTLSPDLCQLLCSQLRGLGRVLQGALRRGGHETPVTVSDGSDANENN